jgi:hypothetical protein
MAQQQPPAESVLLAVLYLIGQDPAELPRHPTDAGAQRMRKLLDPQQVMSGSGAGCRTSLYRVAEVLEWGWGGHQAARIQASLERLSSVALTVVQPGVSVTCGHRMLSFYLDTQTNALVVAVEERAAAVLFAMGNQFSTISLDERARLGSAHAAILHAWLSVWLRQGARSRIGVEALAGHVWRSPAAGARQARRRRARVADALAEIGALRGWSVAIDERGVASIRKPSTREVRALPEAAPQE